MGNEELSPRLLFEKRLVIAHTFFCLSAFLITRDTCDFSWALPLREAGGKVCVCEAPEEVPLSFSAQGGGQ